MEYNPRYPQPFSLSQAIALDPEVAWEGLVLDITNSYLPLTVLTEIARLRNSLLHLKRSQSELQEYLQEEEGDLEVSQAVKENGITIASQDERILMLKLALTHHGYSVASEQTSVPLTSSPSTPLQSRTERLQNTFSSNSNGLDEDSLDESSAVNPELPEIEGREDGVYL